jgi:hypothetical protein
MSFDILKLIIVFLKHTFLMHLKSLILRSHNYACKRKLRIKNLEYKKEPNKINFTFGKIRTFKVSFKKNILFVCN